MAEIFFIASDERALDLVESLRIQSLKSLTFETDLASAVKRLHKENPRFVFIQSSLDGIACDEIATQARMLVDNADLRLILLGDDDAPPGFPPPGFAASLSLTLPTAQLTSDVLQLLSEDFAQTTTAPSALILDDLPDFEIPSFDSIAEPHPAPHWPSEPPEPLVFDAEALQGPTVEKPPEITGSDEIVFFVAAPPPQQEPAEAPAEPTEQAAVQEAAPQRKEKGHGTRPKSLYPSPDQIYRKPPELCGVPEEGDEPAVPEGPETRRLTRPLYVGIALLFAGVLFWRLFAHEPEPQPVQKPATVPAAPSGKTVAQPVPTPAASGEQQALPLFIPRVPADAAYAAAHPGWERYENEKVEFRVFREGGRIMAIQALPVGDAEIGESQVPAWFREAVGAEMPAKGKFKEADGVKVETRRAPGGAEVAIYRTPQSRILGVVLQLAAQRQK
ncbi:hypothetical protein [Geomonas oryzae]|uniref:hypothetical protein n=1 Tax=Geomonas oryzae TaxID=2364273 RepID=UPI00100B15E1|nr:hypothetical protein [Geomonas oryzae]